MRIKTKVVMLSAVGVLLIGVASVIVFCARGMNVAQEHRQDVMQELSYQLEESNNLAEDASDLKSASENEIDEDTEKDIGEDIEED